MVLGVPMTTGTLWSKSSVEKRRGLGPAPMRIGSTRRLPARNSRMSTSCGAIFAVAVLLLLHAASPAASMESCQADNGGSQAVADMFQSLLSEVTKLRSGPVECTLRPIGRHGTASYDSIAIPLLGVFLL